MGGRKDLITAGLTLGALAGAAAKAKGKMSAIIATESGSVVSFTAADAAPVADLTAAIVPVQSGSGDPSPTNIRPISGWTECKVTRAGKNLLENIKAQRSEYTVRIGSAINDYRIHLIGGETYTLSFSAPGQSVGIYKENGGANTTIGISGSSFTASKTMDVQMWIYNGDGLLIDDVTNFQLELGSAATSYKPYQANTYTVTFGSAGTVYGGTLDVTTGKLTVTKAMYTFNGTESFVLLSSPQSVESFNYFRWYSSSFVGCIPNWNINNTAIMSCYPVQNQLTYWYSGGIGKDSVAWTIKNNAGLCIRDDRYSTADDLKAALVGQTMVYLLATDVVYNLTPVEIRTLAEQNTIWADTGSVTVKYTADTKAFIDKYIAARRNG